MALSKAQAAAEADRLAREAATQQEQFVATQKRLVSVESHE